MSIEIFDDRDIEKKGDHLSSRQIDFVVTGGIACIESAKIVRELRRYGASVRVWMTKAATEFVSPRVFEWASKQAAISDLTGAAEHISHADAIVVAPATLDFTNKIAAGLADSSALTMLQSALGRKPIFLVPSMHSSLRDNPIYKKNISSLGAIPHFNFLDPLEAEHKLKMPSPEDLTAEISHALSPSSLKGHKAIISMGPTRSYADEIRYFSNRSSGRLGIEIADELYRRGAKVTAICGPLSSALPRYIKSHSVETRHEMVEAFKADLSQEPASFAIFCAAVLDFEIETPRKGKVSSKENWHLNLKVSPKLIQSISAENLVKVAFKLESGVSDAELKATAAKAAVENGAEFIVANRFEDVSTHEHRAWIFKRSTNEWFEKFSKVEIARCLVDLLAQNRASALKPMPFSPAPEVFRT